MGQECNMELEMELNVGLEHGIGTWDWNFYWNIRLEIIYSVTSLDLVESCILEVKGHTHI